MKKFILLVLAIIIAGGGYYYFFVSNNTEVATTSYEYIKIEKGNIKKTVSATGKIMRGDIITDVIVSGDRKPVIDIDSFEEIVDSLSSGDKIALVGRRSGNRFFVAITVD